VHVKSKNPHNTTFELFSKEHDSFVLRVRKIATDAKAGTVFPEDQGDALANVDILASQGGDYEFVPGAEMDNMQSSSRSAQPFRLPPTWKCTRTRWTNTASLTRIRTGLRQSRMSGRDSGRRSRRQSNRSSLPRAAKLCFEPFPKCVRTLCHIKDRIRAPLLAIELFANNAEVPCRYPIGDTQTMRFTCR
jgi:hypothetical protein